MDYQEVLSKEFKVKPAFIENIIRLVDEGNTIPFIARYRKEATGSLDDQVLRTLSDRLAYLRSLDKRREEVRGHIAASGFLDEALSVLLDQAATLAEIEDLYRPYRPKRKTRASMAKEKGLEPLAAALWAQDGVLEPAALAAGYVDVQRGVENVEAALAGAADIIAEQIADRADLRQVLRRLFWEQGIVTTRAAKDEDSVYRLYYTFRQAVGKIAGHRVLAIDRGEREDYLKVALVVPDERAVEEIYGRVGLRPGAPAGLTAFLKAAAKDAYERLMLPSLEREIRKMLSEQAAEAAIKVFAQNLRQLLLQPPVKGRVTLGLDPAYRTGCKVALVDPTGRVLETAVVYPAPPHNKTAEAKATLSRLIRGYEVEVIAIGNGTASKETEIFVADLITELRQAGLETELAYAVVNEAGASVYSASKLAAEEFPDFDVSQRSAVSIARRLQDPLAELVKIDPKAIGVGQYQHDMPQKRLSEALDGVVEDSVNSVGVDVNTASAALLARVAGINSGVAKSLITFREANGVFTSRQLLKKVPKLGAKAFEQCAGFLRVAESANVLDNTAVHPESYVAAQKLLALCDYDLQDVRQGRLTELRVRLAAIGEEDCARQIEVGLPTLRDIVAELLRPGRDPREALPAPLLRTDVMDLADLREGMELIGTVRNVIDFGAFVDIGVHEDGLVHISQLAERFVKHPADVVKVGDIVRVKVLVVDVERKRISLSMKGLN